MLRIEGDRRRSPRLQLERPCKIFDPRSRKYIAATTRDLSTTGLLLDVPSVVEVKPGETLHVGVAMTRRQGLLQAKEMMEAVVVRSMITVDDHTALAVHFETAQVDVRHDGLQAAA